MSDDEDLFQSQPLVGDEDEQQYNHPKSQSFQFGSSSTNAASQTNNNNNNKNNKKNKSSHSPIQSQTDFMEEQFGFIHHHDEENEDEGNGENDGENGSSTQSRKGKERLSVSSMSSVLRSKRHDSDQRQQEEVDDDENEQEELCMASQASSHSQFQQDFFTILNSGGLKLYNHQHDDNGGSGDERNITKNKKTRKTIVKLQSAMKLRRHLDMVLTRDTQKTQEFVSGFQNYIQNEQNLKSLLLPFETTDQNNNNFYSTSNDTVCKLFLNAESLQMNIAYCLLEKMSELGQQYGEDAEFYSLEDNIPRLILSQFRWLDMITNCKKLADKIMEVMELCPTYLKKEIITSIPEIVDDSEHRKIAEQLKDIMNEQEYTICVLDALSNLNIESDTDLQKELEEFVVDQLRSAQVDDLPVIIRYLLQSANEENAERIVDSIRNELDVSSLGGDFSSMFDILGTQKQKQKKAISRQNKHGEALILDAIQTGIRYKKVIEKSFVSSIEKAIQPHEQKVVDLWVLMIMFGMDNYSEDALRLLKKKIKDGLYSESTIENCITKHISALDSLFSHMIRLAGTFLRNAVPVINKFGQSLYYELFASLVTRDEDRDHTAKQQEAIKNLVTHIGSSSRSEVDAALDVFIRLANDFLKEMRSLSSFFHSLLDFLENLKTDQLRKIYRFFCLLAFAKDVDSGRANRIHDELMIIVRKQVSNVNIKYKKMGIIATCQLLATIGTISKNVRMTQSANEPQLLSADEVQNAKDVLNTTRNYCSKVPIFNIFLCDELTTVVREFHLDPSLLEDIETHCLSNISNFLKQKSDVQNLSVPSKYNKIKTEAWMALNENERSAVDMLSIMLNDESHYYERIWSLFAHVRLYCASSGMDTPSDTLLMAPLTLFQEDVLSDFRSCSLKEKELICIGLFNAINWLREIINGYGGITGPQIRGAVIERLKHINILEEKLDTLLAQFPTFSPPTVNYQLLTADQQTVVATKKKVTTKTVKPKTATKKQKKKSKGSDEEEEVEEDQDMDGEEVGTIDKGSSTYTSSLSRKNLASFKKYLRDFDLSVMDIIATKPFVTDNGVNIALNSQGLYYLLMDLLEKVKVVFVAKVGFWASKSEQSLTIEPTVLLEKLIKLLPFLKFHMNELISRVTRPDEDSMSDDEDTIVGTDGQYFTPCMQLICATLTRVLHYYKNDRSILIRILNAFVSDSTSEDENSSDDTEEIFKRTFEIFSSMEEHIYNVDALASLFDVMVAIVETSSPDKTPLHHALSSVATKLLDRKLKPKSDFLMKLIKARVIWAGENEAKVLNKLIGSMNSFAQDQDISDLPVLTKQSFIVFFKAISVELTVLMTRGIDKKAKEHESINRALVKIWRAIELAIRLLNATAAFNAKKVSIPLLGALLKFSKRFCADFLKLAPALARWFGKEKKNIHKVVQHFTTAAKSITHVGYWEKVEKTPSLAKLVPLIRKDIETCYLKIKNFYQKHGSKWIVSEFSAMNVDGTKVKETFAQEESDEEEEQSDEEIPKTTKKRKRSKVVESVSKKTTTKDTSDDEDNEVDEEPKKKKSKQNQSYKDAPPKSVSKQTAPLTKITKAPSTETTDSTTSKKKADTQKPKTSKQTSVVQSVESVQILSDEEDDEERIEFEDDDVSDELPTRRARALSQDFDDDEEDDEDVLSDYRARQREDDEDDGEDLADFIAGDFNEFINDEVSEDDEYSNEAASEEEEEGTDDDEDSHAFTHSC